MQVEELQTEIRNLAKEIEVLLEKFTFKTGYAPVIDIEPNTYNYAGSKNASTIYSVYCKVSIS